MVNLLTDIHITQASLQANSFDHEDSRILYNHLLSDSILVERGYDKEEVRESIKYYMTNVEELASIYERVLDSVNVRESLSRPGKKIVK